MAVESSVTIFLNKKKWIIPLLFASMCLYFVLTIVACELRGLDNLIPTFAFSIGGELAIMAVAIMITLAILPAYKRQSGYIRIFVTLLTIGCSVCFLDSCQMLVDNVPSLAKLNQVLSIFVFVDEIILVFFFWLFVTYALKSEGKIINVLSIIISIGLIIFTLLPFVNFFYPLYFSVNSAGTYARNTSTWWICRIYLVLIGIFVIIAIIQSKVKVRDKIVIFVFMILPFIAMGIAGYQYGVSLLYTAMMVSLVMMYAILYADNEKSLYTTGKELNLATNIQKHMLPSIFPAFPERKEFDIYALMEPAKEVGGDFYDFFLIDDNHLGIVIADVSDKGVPAALFMMASKIMVQNFALLGYSPKQVLEQVNKQVCLNNPAGMFVTIWLGVLDLSTGIVTCANAGHEKPILKNVFNNFEVVNDMHGLVVGFMKNATYNEYTIKLEKGAKLFLYTDGVMEARSGAESFGMERTLNCLNNNMYKPVEDICKSMLSVVRSYINVTPQFDDITMLCLEYKGK